MAAPHYSPAEVEARLTFLPNWRFETNALHRSLEFADFTAAVGFIIRLALHAEKQNHHPEITNVYNRVVLRLTTHDAGGVTDRDFKLAETVDQLLAQPLQRNG